MKRTDSREFANAFPIIAQDLHVGPVSDPWVKGVSLSIMPGEYVTLTGENGSGKSTFMNAIAGMYEDKKLFRPSMVQGDVFYGGTSIYNLTSAQRRAIRGRHFAMAGQRVDDEINRRETVRENLRSYAEERGARIDEEIFEEVVEYYGLSKIINSKNEKMLDKPAGRLSGGQRQLITIARAEITDPQVLMLDEPYGALSENNRGLVHDRFTHLSQSLGKTVIVVGHDPNRAAPRVVSFELGQIVSDTAPITAQNT